LGIVLIILILEYHGEINMAEYQLRNRHRLRKKVIRDLNEDLNRIFSSNFEISNNTIDSATVGPFEIYIINNEIFAFKIENKLFFTLRGILQFKPSKKFVTVDMGAVKFVADGADIMAPGIVDADDAIQVTDLVWIRDEKNLQPLAIGEAVMPGPKMIISNSDKAVKSLHYIGDKLWNMKI
jgi:PUA domain protein